MTHDVIVVGAGPAGLSCAINAASEGQSFLVENIHNYLASQA